MCRQFASNRGEILVKIDDGVQNGLGIGEEEVLLDHFELVRRLVVMLVKIHAIVDPGNAGIMKRRMVR